MYSIPGHADWQQLQTTGWKAQAGHYENIFQHWNAGKWWFSTALRLHRGVMDSLLMNVFRV